MKRLSSALGAITLLGAIALGGCGSGSAGGVTADSAWARMSPMSAENGAIYMDITASEDDALVGADVGMDTAMMTQIHETTMNADGTMGMSEVESIVLPAGSMVSLAPGGYHIMLMGLKQPLALGDTVAVTLTFESGDQLVVDAEVREEAP